MFAVNARGSCHDSRVTPRSRATSGWHHEPICLWGTASRTRTRTLLSRRTSPRTANHRSAARVVARKHVALAARHAPPAARAVARAGLEVAAPSVNARLAARVEGQDAHRGLAAATVSGCLAKNAANPAPNDRSDRVVALAPPPPRFPFRRRRTPPEAPAVGPAGALRRPGVPAAWSARGHSGAEAAR